MSKQDQLSGARLEGSGVIDLHLQGIFSEILEEPKYLAGQLDDAGQLIDGGSIELSVQRKHEWELILVWVLKAAVYGFIGGAAKKLGERFAAWVLETSRDLKSVPELRAEGVRTVRVDPNDRARALTEVSNLFDEATKKNLKIELVIMPGTLPT
jgi:hypothetical protein